MVIWEKNIVSKWKNGEVQRYEWVSPFSTIDVTMERNEYQGYAGSNHVAIFVESYGGFVLGTPKNFSTKKQAREFVSKAKKKLESKEYGKMIPFKD